MRNIIGLIDCDSFYASCEQADNPDLFGKPVCVMSQINDRGIVLARSKETKKIGIKMCDPFFKIKNTPDIIFLPARMHRYQEISADVMDIVKNYSPDVEVASIDEAYIDLTSLDKIYKKKYTEIAQDIRNEIFEKLKITVSIGLSTSKLLAKLASEQAKKSGGVFAISPKDVLKKVGHLPINNVSGIGKQHDKQLQKARILTIADFISKDNTELRNILGATAIQLKVELMGEALSKVDRNPHPPKSIQSSHAFADFTSDKYFIGKELNFHIQQACRKLRNWQGYASVIGIMLKHKDFNTVIQKERIKIKTDKEQEIQKVVLKLFKEMFNPNAIYRSCGISLDDISFTIEQQQSLFDKAEIKEKDDNLSKAIDALENKFGDNIVKTGWL